MARSSIRKRMKEQWTKNRTMVVLFLLTFVTTCLFIVALLLQNRGMFTITTPRLDMISYGFVLSETPGFEHPRHELHSSPVIDMWNITESWLPPDLEKTDGDHNGENYLAFTFYGKNTGIYDFDYRAYLDIREMHLEVDKALRIRMYINDEPVLYAKPKSDGSGEPEPGTVPFINDVRMVDVPQRRLNVGQVDKYTVVAWLEGEDPECIDSILGGFVKLQMDFRVVPIKDEDGKQLV